MRPIVIAALLLLAACASRADRIATALENRGVPERKARCMGERLADRLEDGQLLRLNQLAKLNRDRAGRMTLDQLLDQLNRDGDPQLVAKVVKAGLHCAF